MQSIKFVVRQIGISHKGLGIESAEDAEQYIQYQYLSQGYRVQSTHYLGEVKGERAGDVLGYKVMLILVKDDVANLMGEAVASASDLPLVPEKRKVGRPKAE